MIRVFGVPQTRRRGSYEIVREEKAIVGFK